MTLLIMLMILSSSVTLWLLFATVGAALNHQRRVLGYLTLFVGCFLVSARIFNDCMELLLQ